MQMFMSQISDTVAICIQSTDIACSNHLRSLAMSAATVVYMVADLPYVGNNDEKKRKHLDMQYR